MEARTTAQETMSLSEAESSLRQIFRDGRHCDHWNVLRLSEEECTRVVRILQQHGSLAKSRALCRRCEWIKMLPLSALLQYGGNVVSIEQIRTVYHLYPSACAQDAYYSCYAHKARDKGPLYSNKGTIYPLRLACKYANADVIEFLATVYPAAVSHVVRGNCEPYAEWLPVQVLLGRSTAFLASTDFQKAMNVLLDLAPETLLYLSLDPDWFMYTFLHTVIHKGMTDTVRSILQRKRLPAGFDSFSWNGTFESLECIKALALILPMLKSFRFCPRCHRGPSAEALFLLREELLKCQTLERFQVSWKSFGRDGKKKIRIVDDLCLRMLKENKNIQELLLDGFVVGFADCALEHVRFDEYASILENENDTTCVCVSISYSPIPESRETH